MTSVSLCVAKRWPRASSSRAQLAVVVDLAVEDDHDRAVLVEDRLVAGREVDDAQALDAEPDRRHRHAIRASPGRGARAPRTCAASASRVGVPPSLLSLSDDPAHGASHYPRGRCAPRRPGIGEVSLQRISGAVPAPPRLVRGRRRLDVVRPAQRHGDARAAALWTAALRRASARRPPPRRVRRGDRPAAACATAPHPADLGHAQARLNRLEALMAGGRAAGRRSRRAGGRTDRRRSRAPRAAGRRRPSATVAPGRPPATPAPPASGSARAGGDQQTVLAVLDQLGDAHDARRHDRAAPSPSPP